MELFKDNYISYNWSGKTQRSGGEDCFYIDFQPCSRKPLPFREECLATARYIADTVKEPLVILMSGGIDSEIVVRSFLEAGVSFKVIFFSFLPNRSRDDIPMGIEFCKSRNISFEIIPFDIVKFLKEEAMSYIHKYKIHEPFAAVDIRKMEMIDGYPIFGNGDVYLEWDKESNSAFSVEQGSYCIPWIWQKENQKQGCWRFFKFTAEVLASSLIDPLTKTWVQLAPKMSWQNNRVWKNLFAKQHWPDLYVREKLTGYERVAGEYLALQRELKPLYSYKKDICYWPYKELIKKLLPKWDN